MVNLILREQEYNKNKGMIKMKSVHSRQYFKLLYRLKLTSLRQNLSYLVSKKTGVTQKYITHLESTSVAHWFLAKLGIYYSLDELYCLQKGERVENLLF